MRKENKEENKEIEIAEDTKKAVEMAVQSLMETTGALRLTKANHFETKLQSNNFIDIITDDDIINANNNSIGSHHSSPVCLFLYILSFFLFFTNREVQVLILQ